MHDSGNLPEELGNALETVVGCPLFKGISREELAALLLGSSCRIRRFGRGDLLAQAGDEVHFLHIMVSGTVKGEMVDFTGKVIKIEDIVPPFPLAPAFLFGRQNQYPVNIQAIEQVEVLSIPREGFLKMMQSSEKLLRSFVDAISNRSQFLSSKIRYLTFSSIRGKLARYLMDISQKLGSASFELPHSQAQLSELFGVTRPSVGRAMADLNREGILKTEGRMVTLLDMEKLNRELDSFEFES